jgi:hypothetical protein
MFNLAGIRNRIIPIFALKSLDIINSRQKSSRRGAYMTPASAPASILVVEDDQDDQ